MKEAIGDRLQIKASGGICTRAFAQELLDAGADRIGAGNGMILLNQCSNVLQGKADAPRREARGYS